MRLVGWLRRTPEERVTADVVDTLRSAQEAGGEVQARLDRAIQRYRLLSEFAAAERLLGEIEAPHD